MARPKGTIHAVCQNEDCFYYLKEDGKDIIKRGKYRTGHQRYLCKRCNTFFMETKGSPLYRKHLKKDEIILICNLLVEKNGIRSIKRITNHHRGTITRLIDDLSEHAETINDFLLRDLGLKQYEIDELWTFVKKNRRKSIQKAHSHRKKETRTSSIV